MIIWIEDTWSPPILPLATLFLAVTAVHGQLESHVRPFFWEAVLPPTFGSEIQEGRR